MPSQATDGQTGYDMTFECESERLVAEQAVLAFRATRAAMHAAPFGDGLAFTERAALIEGRKAVEAILSEAIKAHLEVEKGGSTASRARAPGASGGRGSRPSRR